MLLTLLVGCGHNMGMEYEKSISSIQDTITEAPSNWKPDTMIRLDYNTISEILQPFLQDVIGSGKFSYSILGNPIQITINNKITSLQLKNAQNDRLKLKVNISGAGSWKALGLTSKIPYQGSVTLQLSILYKNGSVQIVIADISSVDVAINNNMVDLSKPFQTWISEELQKLKPQSVLEIDTSQIPYLDFRVKTTLPSINIEGISHYNHQQYLSPKIEALTEDFQIRISNGLINTFLRIGGQEIDTQINGLYVDPYGLSFFDDKLSILVRLWKTEGWMQGMRGYQVNGTYSINKNNIMMQLDSFEKLEESMGYMKLNPIVMLGENFIEHKVLDRIRPVIPSSKDTKIKKYTIDAQLKSIGSDANELFLNGDITMSNQKK